VLPIVTRGATENLNSLLYLRGVDTAIVNSASNASSSESRSCANARASRAGR
jgi:hypothetical protein